MPRTYNAKPPVKPIGRILYSERYSSEWDPKMYSNGGYRSAGYQKVCECKGFSDDRPFSIYKYERELATNEKPPKKSDPKPFKVIFHWTNEHFKNKKVQRQGEWREEIDGDTYHMMDVLEEHATLTAAQKSMRKFASDAFAKVNDAPQRVGDKCHNVWVDDEGAEHDIRVGDLISYEGISGAVWRVLGERRASDEWKLKVEPVFSFLNATGAVKPKELEQRDVYSYVRPIDLVQLGVAYTMLGNLMKDEAKRRAE